MKRIVILTLILVGLVVFYSIPVLADQPPDPGGDPTGGNPVGGGSPLGGGMITFLIAALYYGVKKAIKAKKH